MDTNKALSWISAAGGMLGAALCSSGHMAIGYPFFFVGSVAGVVALRHNMPMLLQFLFFTACNAYGILNFTL